MARHLTYQFGGMLFLATLLAACATPPTSTVTVATPATESTAPDNPKAAPDVVEAQSELTPPVDESSYPKQALTRELLFGFLMGDIALQRGERSVAAQTWLELAKRTRDPRAAKRAVETSFAAGQVSNAISATKLWRELEPNSLQARQMLVNVLTRTGKLVDAEVELTAWLAEHPEEAPGILMQVHTLWPNDVDKKAVLALVQRLGTAFPKLGEASLAVAAAANNAGESATALSAADEAIRRKPGWETAILYRAAITDQQSAADAITFLRKASNDVPMSRDIKAALARSLSDAKQIHDAYKVYGELNKAYPDNVEYLLGEALSAIQLRQYVAAEAPLTRALALGVNKPSAIQYYLGLVAEEQGHFDVARNRYREAVASATDSQATMRLARVEARLGNEAGALAAVSQLPETTAEQQITRIQTEAQVWRDLKNIIRARSTLDAGLNLHRDSTDLLYDRSLIFDQLGDVKAAEADLRRYLALAPDSALALNALGYTLANHTNRFDEAESLLQKAIAQEPNNPVIIDSMGWLQFRKGKLDEAIKWLSRAFSNMPDPEIAAHYGEALWQTGKQAEARKVWEAGTKLDPTHEVLSETVKRLTGK